MNPMDPSLVPHSRPWITEDDHAALARVLDSGMVGSGELCRTFERRMAAWVCADAGAVALSSGTAALTLALTALEVRPGDEVVLPTYVCPSVLDAVLSVGAVPVVCDVGPHWVVDAASLAPHITDRTRALIVPHVFGIYADIGALRRLGVPIIEDCAQALDASGTRPITGDIAVFSFHATKCLTTGEGGMAISRDPVLIDRLARLRRGDPRRRVPRLGAPLSDLAAALGCAQLDRYHEGLARRLAFASQYRIHLSAIAPHALTRQRPRHTMWFRFPISLAGGLPGSERAFARAGVTVRRGVDRLVHRELGLADHAFPVARELFETTVSLPIYPALPDELFDRCLRAFTEVLRDGALEQARCA